MTTKVLVANRGEIAVRIIRAIREINFESVSIFPEDDAESLHASYADEHVQLPGVGAAAYLDIEAVVHAARQSGCTAVHPGYGFLSENSAFARACEAAGITFIGPSAETLDTLGDKARARAFAVEQRVPVLPGTVGITTLEQAQQFMAEHGAVMLKALAGGGGRGMREVTDAADLAEAYARCSSEARSAFGDDALYVERLVRKPRHIEIQIAGDGSHVQHLWERDCSIQRRHQKLIEVAPSPALDADLRERILQAGLRMAQALNYRQLGTFEFLVEGEHFYFMEANPRLQVEHTVTEEVTGVDLVMLQLRLLAGQSLQEQGLDTPPPLSGYAVQARINLETLAADGTPRPSSGLIRTFVPPSGPGVRVDTYGRAGYRVSPRYDSLIAKVIGRAADFSIATDRTAAALAEFEINGVQTNLDLTHAIVTDADFRAGHFDTSYIAEHLQALLAHRRPRRVPDAGEEQDGPDQGAAEAIPEHAHVLRAPMSGVLLELRVAVGDVVAAGAPVAVVEAMKMEHVVLADRSMRVDAVLKQPGAVLDDGAVLMYGSASDAADAQAPAVAGTPDADDDWSAEVQEIERRREMAMGMGGPAKVKKQHDGGKLTARERIDALVDPGSFREIGVLTGFSSYDESGHLLAVLPANFVGGTALLDGRKVMLGVDDFTRRGGSGDSARHEKQLFIEAYAGTMRLPVVRLLDGQSGGGSVEMVRKSGFTYVPRNPAWDSVVDNLSLVPVVAAGLGPVVGLGAARFVMSHLAILVEGLGQLFTAGPPVVRHALGEDLSKEQLGGAAVHRENGSVERFVPDEASAFAMVRQFLSYLPSSVFEMPPVQPCTDPVTRREEFLLGAVPRNLRRLYAIRPIMEAVFDRDSIFTYAEYGGGTVTALARLDGHPVGVLAQDPAKGAAMSVAGAQAICRLVDLCDMFHLPLVSLTDQAGVNIGLAAERAGSIRAGTRAISAVYQARIPQAEIVLRRVYGVGGAGIVNRHRANRSWSWPSGTWGSLPARGGIEAAFRAEIAASSDPEATIAAIAQELDALSSPFRTAEHFGVQDLIDPRDTRELLCDWVRTAYRVLPEQLGRPALGVRP